MHYGEYVPGYVSSYTQWKIGWMYFAIVVKKNGSLLEWSCFRTINRGIVSLSLSFFFNKSNFLIYLKKKKRTLYGVLKISESFHRTFTLFSSSLLFFLLNTKLHESTVYYRKGSYFQTRENWPGDK